MNLGTGIVLIALIALVSAIVASWVKARRSGKHIACDECGGCSCGDPTSASCGCATLMVEHLDETLKDQSK